ncbi:MAG: LCP family protein [Tissierellia bacterium]|nr:LCP family protein [Tissierellia bacterium]
MKEKRTSRGVKIGRVIFTFFLLALISISLGLEFLPNLNTISIPKDDEKLGIVKKEDVNMDEEQLKVYEEKSKGVQNILLIGVDEEGYDSGRSDVMMVVSLDSNHNAMKLTSVMRDTLSYIPTSQTYQKLNHSYSEGGPLETMKAINRNFDLNMRDFVVFDFAAVSKAVDLIGGYPVYIDADEAFDMGRSSGREYYDGEQILDGEGATMYMRIRYNSGGDQGRNQRQRDLILYLLEYAKSMGRREMVGFAKEMMPTIRTSYSFSDIEKLMDIYDGMKDGLKTEQYSFPFNYEGVTLNDGLWYAVPGTMRSNVITLQENIFASGSYVPSVIVDDISYSIENLSGVYSE